MWTLMLPAVLMAASGTKSCLLTTQKNTVSKLGPISTITRAGKMVGHASKSLSTSSPVSGSQTVYTRADQIKAELEHRKQLKKTKAGQGKAQALGNEAQLKSPSLWKWSKARVAPDGVRTTLKNAAKKLVGKAPLKSTAQSRAAAPITNKPSGAVGKPAVHQKAGKPHFHDVRPPSVIRDERRSSSVSVPSYSDDRQPEYHHTLA